MGAQVEIRPVEDGDAAGIQLSCYTRNTVQQVQAMIAEHATKARDGKAVQLVAVLDGAVVGTAILGRCEHDLYAHRAEVLGLVVAPEHQRQGIARRLVAACAEHARTMGIEILEIGCRGGTPAEEVYRRLGFIEWGRLPGGIREPWGENRAFDSVRFYLATADS